MARAPGDRHRERGFTLMELLVALTLLGMLMAALFGGLSLGTRVWQSGNERQEAYGQLMAVRSFLRQRLEESEPAADAAERDREEPVFVGAAKSLTLASSMPASVGPGVFLIHLELGARREGEPVSDLTVRWRPLSNGIAADIAGSEGERVLIEDVADVDIAYFGAADDGAARRWHDRWRSGGDMPELIRLDLRFPAGDVRQWPPLIVSPMIDAWYDPT